MIKIAGSKQYNDIAEAYFHTDEAIEKKYSTIPTFMKLCGDLKGKEVIDLACGSGSSSRNLQKLGAKRVVGIDISKKEINLAKKLSPEIEYCVGDVLSTDLSQYGKFDLAAAMFLLHYNSTREELRKMCANIFKCVKPRGRFVGIVGSTKDGKKLSNKYGVTCEGPYPFVEGGKRLVTYFKDGKELCSFGNYFWRDETYVNILEDIGFVDVKIHQQEVSREGIDKFGEEFWRELIEGKDVIVITCKKS